MKPSTAVVLGLLILWMGPMAVYLMYEAFADTPRIEACSDACHKNGNTMASWSAKGGCACAALVKP
jgi:hypothetical protein